MPRTTVPVRFGSLRFAVLFSFIFHGALIITARYRLSYDAYNHMFFGDHYRMDWWSLWDTRWYTGFSVNSYPPLVHQLIGALSHLIGIDAAFALVLWITVTLFPLGLYAFTRIFLGRSAAGYAALGAAFLPSVYLAAHIFGQLPTLAGTLTALFAVAALHRYLREGSRLDGAMAVSLLSTVMAFHHGTLLFLPWLVLAVTVRLFLSRQITWQRLAGRLLVVAMFSALAMLLVIWPFWEWGRAQSLQTPIDHASRHNFFQDPLAAVIFFLPVYGPLMILIPRALSLARHRKLSGLGIAFCVLFLLGLGGTTPLPHWLFGEGWAWLTYDRFAFWASVTLLPFFGIFMILLRRQRSRGARTKVFLTLGATSMIVGLITTFLPLQPGAVDMRQVVGFLEQDDRSNWRYVTFGFGDQLALLSTLTGATTIDGSYHTARTLPELRSSGLGQIDTAFWIPNGLAALDPILQKSGEHGVRWGFVNVSKYVPVLERNGWVKVKAFKGGVQVWENPNAKLPPQPQVPSPNTLASFSWGTLPVLSLITSLSLGSLRLWPRSAEYFLRACYTFCVALLPLGICFWYFRTIYTIPHERVYFIYTDALFFLADGFVLLAVILWLALKIKYGSPLSSSLVLLPSALCILTFLSIYWSRDPRTSLYVSLHILLVFLLILSLRDRPDAWKLVLAGLCAALSIQLVAGLVGFVSQSTAFLAPLHLTWPGPTDPSVRGAVVVQLPGGQSFLRAYGSLPHPNILGGFALTFLLGPIAFFLRRDQPNNLGLLLLIPGVSLLALTFSRSAWLALVVFSMVLLWKSSYFERRRVVVMLTIMALTFVMTLLPYHELVQARTVNTTSHAEEFSFIGRAWLNGSAVRMIQEYPLAGVGIGAFTVELAERAGEGYVVEPAHNILLMAGAELGIPGLLLVLALMILFAWRLFKTQNPNAILAGAALTGLVLIAMFDHYIWTLAPGRLLLGLVIGLFVGQEFNHEA